MALSGHWLGRRACPLLGVKQTSLVRDWVSVNDPGVDLEENRHGDSNSTFPAKNYGLPAFRIREKPIQATEMQGVFCWDVKACPCNLAKSPCNSPNCRERRVGFRLPAQPQHKSRI
jgi:hypothetical protein